MEIKVVLLSLSLAVVLGAPAVPLVQHPVVGGQNQSPLLGDWVPVQGHVVVENPAPQLSLSFNTEQQEKLTPVVLKLKEKMLEGETEEKLEVTAEPEMEKELHAEPDFKVDSEVKVELDVQTEEEPEELDDAQPDVMIEDRHVDTEPMKEPGMELEPLNDDDKSDEEEELKELPDEEMSFRRGHYVAEHLTEEEEEFLIKRNYVLEEQPIMEMEPEMREETVSNPVVMSGGALMDEEPSLEQQMSKMYLPDKEAQMEMFVREEDEGLQLDVRQQALRRENTNRQEASRYADIKATGERYCPGMLSDGKCFQFFKAAKKYGDAEFFCQEQFSGGHLASISSQYVHRGVMNLILMQNGAYTRTWVGGRRLDGLRFVWLDGSRWTYDDWLPGEPNNTAGVEDCVEVLALGNGQFNDFTCWEPQPFICSYPYQ